MSKICLTTYEGENASVTPYSNARVYFSCHPADFQDTFDVLAKDMYAAYQFTCIYYEAEWEIPANPEELKVTLGEVRLLIIPITRRYLTEESRSISFELKFAIDKHIPVIPILFEPNVEELYVKRMRELGENYEYIQFLDRTVVDSTTAPYARKLKDYFSKLFDATREMENVSEVFRKTLFLSYRKVNRSNANDLMRKIHSIPGLWDVAIWYDDFLVPGEKWNDAIQEAANKSDAMLLSITPSILEPKNYVIVNEYPTFINANKKIIPIEMLPTDAKELQMTFPDIPAVVDGNDEKALKEACTFLMNDEEVASKRIYLAGIAYQGGMYVERDSQRAVNLFTMAYNKGYYKAAGKIALMYEIGDGVPINYEESAIWYEKYVLGLEQDEKQFAGIVAVCFIRVAHKFELAKQYEKARGYYEYANGLIWQMELQSHSRANWSNLRSNYISLAKISRKLSEYEKEVYYLDRAKRFPNVEKNELDETLIYSLRIRILQQFGLDFLQDDNPEMAASFFTCGLQLMKEITDSESISRQITANFFDACMQLICRTDFCDGGEFGKACQTTLKKLISLKNYEEYHRKLIGIDEYLGQFFIAMGADEKGVFYYREGAESARVIAEFTHKVKDYDKYGSLLLKLSIWGNAEEMETAVHLYEVLAEKYPSNVWFEMAKKRAKLLLDGRF